MTLGEGEARRQQAVELLQEMKEDALTETIVIPLFQRLGWICTKVDRRHEDEHCCDVLLTLPGEEDEILLFEEILH